MAVFPVIPGHSFRIDLTIEVQTIQFGVETSVVPPGACITQGTFATTSFVIITILDGTKHATTRTKGITSGTYKKKKNAKYKCSVIFS